MKKLFASLALAAVVAPVCADSTVIWPPIP